MFGMLLFGLLLFCTSCEKEIKLSDLPPAIEAWIAANRPGFSADEAEKETLCDGTVVYDIEAEKGEDEEIELTFDMSGTFLYSESEMEVANLPMAVTTGIGIKFPGATILEADKKAMADGSTQYEVEVKVNGAKKEASFDSAGGVVCVEGEKP